MVRRVGDVISADTSKNLLSLADAGTFTIIESVNGLCPIIKGLGDVATSSTLTGEINRFLFFLASTCSHKNTDKTILRHITISLGQIPTNNRHLFSCTFFTNVYCIVPNIFSSDQSNTRFPDLFYFGPFARPSLAADCGKMACIARAQRVCLVLRNPIPRIHFYLLCGDGNLSHKKSENNYSSEASSSHCLWRGSPPALRVEDFIMIRCRLSFLLQTIT